MTKGEWRYEELDVLAHAGDARQIPYVIQAYPCLMVSAATPGIL